MMSWGRIGDIITALFFLSGNDYKVLICPINITTSGRYGAQHFHAAGVGIPARTIDFAQDVIRPLIMRRWHAAG
jgi:hypothetical protein